jgi:hypothetical protein
VVGGECAGVKAEHVTGGFPSETCTTPDRARREPTDVIEIGFDYSTLEDQETADAVRAAAESINCRKNSIHGDIVGIGIDLLGVKGRLSHGQFGAWIEAEFGMTPRTAQNYMSVAEVFGSKYEIVSHLKPTTIVSLAAPSISAEVRGRIIDCSKGERHPDHVVKLMLKDAKQKNAERKPDGNKRLAPGAMELGRSNEARQREVDEALAGAVTIIRDRVGDALPRLLALFDRAGLGGPLAEKLRAAAMSLTVEDVGDGPSATAATENCANPSTGQRDGQGGGLPSVRPRAARRRPRK